jgi:hypothetical protein
VAFLTSTRMGPSNTTLGTIKLNADSPHARARCTHTHWWSIPEAPAVPALIAFGPLPRRSVSRIKPIGDARRGRSQLEGERVSTVLACVTSTLGGCMLHTTL